MVTETKKHKKQKVKARIGESVKNEVVNVTVALASWISSLREVESVFAFQNFKNLILSE